jgi:mutual gliding-motility protein MglA
MGYAARMCMRLMLGLTILLGLTVAPRARAAFVDDANKEVTLKLVYFPSAATSVEVTKNLEYIFAKASKGGKLERRKNKGDILYYDFLPLTLGDIRGWKTNVHLFGLPAAKTATAARLLLLKASDGIVFVADAAPASARANADSLAELRSSLAKLGEPYAKLPIVVQVVGTTKADALPDAEVVKALGIADLPRYMAIPTTGVGVFDTLKALTKLALAELKALGAGSSASPTK